MNFDFLKDLTLVCSDGEIKVFALLWCKASEVFTAMLTNNMLEKTQKVIKLEQFNLATVSKIDQMLNLSITVDVLNGMDLEFNH